MQATVPYYWTFLENHRKIAKSAKMEKFAVRQIHGELRGPLQPYFLSGDPFCPVVC
jgi:hypothetical protein